MDEAWARRVALYQRTVEENPWVVWKPQKNPKQRAFLLLSDIMEVFYGGAAGGGKALQVDTPIPTPSGWSRMGDLQVGDAVFSADGTPTRVTAAYDAYQANAWELTFSDGSKIVADGPHKWLTFSNAELNAMTRLDPAWRAKRRAKRPSRSNIGAKNGKAYTHEHRQFLSEQITRRNRERRHSTKPPPSGTVRTTDEIVATIERRGRANHAIPLAAPLDCPPSDLPLDPYLLGVWLGDGTSRGGQLTMADEDCQIAVEVAQTGRNVVKLGSKFVWAIRGLTTTLRQMGLLRNKHVPEQYLRASKAQRLALLQGLMDTDGTCDQTGTTEFCNTNERLADAVFELAVSLGCKPTKREGRAKLYGKDCGPKWTVAWTTDQPMFRLKRKLARQKIEVRRTNRFRYIVSARRVENVTVRCISVDHPSRLFLAGRSMISTHNSVALLMAAAQFVDVPGYSALLLRENYKDLEQPGCWIPMSKSWWKTKASWNQTNTRWTFPSGATITFGYLDKDDAVYQYDSAEFQFIGIDELTQHTENRYRFLFNRLRSKKDGPLSEVPLRYRTASNPGGKGHAWCKKRFVDPKTREAGAAFIPATLNDNAGYLDTQKYKSESLSKLDPVTRRQREEGDWDAFEGGRFQPQWFAHTFENPAEDIWRLSPFGQRERTVTTLKMKFQTCDPAASTKTTADRTVIATWGVTDRCELLWLDCKMVREEVPEIVPFLLSQYRRWSPSFVAIEGVGANDAVLKLARREPMVVKALSPRGLDKLVRATPAITYCESGRVFVPQSAPWLEEALAELTTFTGDEKRDAHDDVVDALSYAVWCLDGLSAQSGQSFTPYIYRGA